MRSYRIWMSGDFSVFLNSISRSIFKFQPKFPIHIQILIQSSTYVKIQISNQYLNSNQYSNFPIHIQIKLQFINIYRSFFSYCLFRLTNPLYYTNSTQFSGQSPRRDLHFLRLDFQFFHATNRCCLWLVWNFKQRTDWHLCSNNGWSILSNRRNGLPFYFVATKNERWQGGI